MKASASDIRTRVSRSYASALDATERGTAGCCGPETGCAHPSESTKRSEVPSFGCGDPLLFANVRKGATVLDLGSGAGYDLIAAAERVGPSGRVIGVDMTDEMIAAARRNVALAGLTNVEVRKGFIEDLPVESQSVDWVISNCVINLSPEKDRVFSEIARVLKPGGAFSISDICAENLPEHVLQDETAYDGCIAGAISEDEYVAGLRKAGFTNLLIDAKVRYEMDVDPATVEKSQEEASAPSADEGPSESEPRIWSIRFTGRKPL